MTKLYRSLLVALLIGLLTLIYAPMAAAAPEDEPTGMSGVSLRIYPEYDQPQLLVILRGQLTGVTASAANPATVRFLIPSTAVPYSAGFINTQGIYERGGFVDPTKTVADPYPETETSEIAGWNEISFTINTNSFVVEYYDPVIPTAAAKEINYKLHFRYPIADLVVYIMQPRASSDFVVSPAGNSITHNAFGKEYPAQSYNYTSLTVEDHSPLAYDISYTKSDSRPSDSIPEGAAASVATVIVSLIVVVIIIAAIVIIVLRQKTRTRRRPTGKARTKVKRQKFCRECGKKMDRATPHCPYCGTKQK